MDWEDRLRALLSLGWFVEEGERKTPILPLIFLNALPVWHFTSHSVHRLGHSIFITRGPKENMYQIRLSNRNNPVGLIGLNRRVLLCHLHVKLDRLDKMALHVGMCLINYVTFIAFISPFRWLMVQLTFLISILYFSFPGLPGGKFTHSSHFHLSFLSSALPPLFITFQANLHKIFIITYKCPMSQKDQRCHGPAFFVRMFS